MPQGNAHFLPSGIWSLGPTTDSVPRMFLKTCRNLSFFVIAWFLFDGYRTMQVEKTYNRYIGKTMTLGNLSILTHQPLSVEEVDKLKAAEAERKRLARAMKKLS